MTSRVCGCNSVVACGDIEARVNGLWQWLCVDSLLSTEDGDKDVTREDVGPRRAVSESGDMTHTSRQVGLNTDDRDTTQLTTGRT